ncbi:MAG: hypothetical protein J6W31_05035, partial [Clostridia bacterium]|nr:hypothetical protein [Clostridia bacterium]
FYSNSLSQNQKTINIKLAHLLYRRHAKGDFLLVRLTGLEHLHKTKCFALCFREERFAFFRECRTIIPSCTPKQKSPQGAFCFGAPNRT